MKKLIAAVVVVIIVAVGAFVLFGGGSSNKNPNGTTPANNQHNAPAVNNAVLATKTDPSLGQYLADPSGKPLYTYNADSPGVSNCTGACLVNWPAYQDTGATTDLPTDVSTIKRADNGQTQYTYKGMPLYYFTGDSSGKVTGDGVENFSVAMPAAASSSTSTPAPSQSNTSSTYPY